MTSLPCPSRITLDDVYVSLETIEHVVDDRALLCEVARVLRAGAGSVRPTSNRVLTNPGTSIDDRPFNPHHVREYSAAEFESLMKEHFKDVQLYYQTSYGRRYSRASRLVGEEAPLSRYSGLTR